MSTIPESNQYDPEGTYSRPQFQVSYYSERINAHAFTSFKSRHDAIGYIAKELREGRMKRPTLKYVEGYHSNEETTQLGAWANSW